MVSSIGRIRCLHPQRQTQSQDQSLVEQTPNHPHPSLFPGGCPAAQLKSSISSSCPMRFSQSGGEGRTVSGLRSYCLGRSLNRKPQRPTVAGTLCSPPSQPPSSHSSGAPCWLSLLSITPSPVEEQDLSPDTLPCPWPSPSASSPAPSPCSGPTLHS